MSTSEPRWPAHQEPCPLSAVAGCNSLERWTICHRASRTRVARPKWRNWQTRRTQNPLFARTCGFDSHLRHNSKSRGQNLSSYRPASASTEKRTLDESLIEGFADSVEDAAMQPKSKMRSLTRLATLLEPVRAGAQTRGSGSIDRESWRRALGERLALKSEPETVHGKVLTVLVASSVWAQELSLLAPEIINRLRQAGFPIGELRWRVGKLKSTARMGSKLLKIIPLTSLPSNLEQALCQVADSELRNAIFQAAAHVMARQQQVLRYRALSAKRPNARAPRSAGLKISPPAPDAQDPHAVLPRTRAKRQD